MCLQSPQEEQGGQESRGEQDMTTEAQGSGTPPDTQACVPISGEKVLQEFQILVQKVGGRPEVLLIGETLEGQDIHGLMSSFVKDLFSATCHPVSPADALKEPCVTSCSLGGQQCQLIFFLCRASCLKAKQAELKKVLKEVKKFVQKSPCALVGIIMEPTKGEAEAARNQLLRMLRSAFPKAPAAVHKRGKQAVSKGDQSKAGAMELEDVEVEAEVYVPGHPRGHLAIMKAACRASDALTKSGSSWTSVAIKSLLGTACVAGMASAAGWYLYTQDMIPPEMLPTALLPSS